MNSSGSSFNCGARSSIAGASFGSYQFDFDLAGSARGSASRPLKDQKPTAPYAAPSSAAAPSWSHQPSSTVPTSARSSNLNAPASMVGDIGKCWASANPSLGSGSPSRTLTSSAISLDPPSARDGACLQMFL